MKKVLVVYWSGTGNTEAMAEAIGAGAREVAEREVAVLSVADVTKEAVLQAELLAFGCPAMGNEVLEESEMEPFIESLSGEKGAAEKVALFGSYDWGDGQWLRDWADRMTDMGFSLLREGLAIQNAPDETGLAECRELGKQLASS
ncbi:MAG: flavodoxin [Sporomusaceae bacterium]|nr:flavodoxin [Sporomusaceae bacterium]